MPRHLIHIGFPKTGSTALQSWFAHHPELVYAPTGLAGHRDGDDLAERAASGGELEPWCVTSAERLSVPRSSQRDADVDAPGDVPLAERRRRACGLLRALFGDATILIVTRGFEGVLASAYSQHVRVGGTMSPRELLDPSHQTEDYFDYDATIALYGDAFGDERLIVLPYELLRDDPGAFVAALERRLGVTTSGRLPPRLYLSLSAAELYWYPRLTRVVAKAAAPFGRRGERLLAFYRARIGGPDLGRGISLLARVAGGRQVEPSTLVPAEVLDRCRGRAAVLCGLPHYAPYAAEYLNDAG